MQNVQRRFGSPAALYLGLSSLHLFSSTKRPIEKAACFSEQQDRREICKGLVGQTLSFYLRSAAWGGRKLPEGAAFAVPTGLSWAHPRSRGQPGFSSPHSEASDGGCSEGPVSGRPTGKDPASQRTRTWQATKMVEDSSEVWSVSGIVSSPAWDG